MFFFADKFLLRHRERVFQEGVGQVCPLLCKSTATAGHSGQGDPGGGQWSVTV